MGPERGKKLLILLIAAAVMVSAAGAAAPEAPETDVDALPLWLAEETAEPGTVEYLRYESRAKGGTPARAGVYVPFGYDPEKMYDVLVLWPGTGSGPETALTEEQPCRMENGEIRSLSAVHVLDRLIETGRIRPVIVICPEEITRGKLPAARADLETVWELAAERFSLYAADETLSPEERREHTAFLGFSQGAVYTQTLAMAEHFGEMAHFAAVCYGSRSTTGARAVNASDLPLETLYFLVGNERDGGAEPGRRAYRDIVWRCREKVREGENAFFRRSAYYGHDYALALVALTDMLPRIWPGENE